MTLPTRLPSEEEVDDLQHLLEATYALHRARLSFDRMPSRPDEELRGYVEAALKLATERVKEAYKATGIKMPPCIELVQSVWEGIGLIYFQRDQFIEGRDPFYELPLGKQNPEPMIDMDAFARDFAERLHELNGEDGAEA